MSMRRPSTIFDRIYGRTTRLLPAVLVFVTGIVLTVGMILLVERYEADLRSEELGHFADERFRSLDDHIRHYEDALAALHGFYRANENQVSREQFHLLTKPLMKRIHGIQALEWIPRVPADDLPAFEARTQKTYLGFQITRRDKQGLMSPVIPAGDHFPVYFVEPFQGNEAAFGFDLASDPERLDALNQSRDTSQLVASARIKLVQETESQYGMLMFLPVFEHGITTNSTEARRKHLRGFILGVFRLGDIVEQALASLAPRDVDLLLVDITERETPELLAFHSDNGGRETVPETELLMLGNRHPDTHERTMQVAGRTWSMVLVPGAAYPQRSRFWLHPTMALIGVLLSSVMAAYLGAVLSRKAEVEHAVRQRTIDLTGAVTRLSRTEADLRVANTKLDYLSRVDELTGLANRRSFDETLDREFRRARRKAASLSLILCDIDHFKQYNDRYGHPAGDLCLQLISDTIRATFRRGGDQPTRYGGEEFAIIISDAEPQAVVQTAEKLRRDVIAMQLPHEDSKTDLFVSVSLGVAFYHPERHHSITELISDTDAALYEAKHLGRNRVVVAEG